MFFSVYTLWRILSVTETLLIDRSINHSDDELCAACSGCNSFASALKYRTTIMSNNHATAVPNAHAIPRPEYSYHSIIVPAKAGPTTHTRSFRNSQSAGHGFNRHVLRRSGNKLGGSSGHTIKRNSAHIASKSPTVPRTTHHSVKKGSQGYSGRSISRTSTHKRSLKNSQSADHGFNRHVLRRSGNKSGASNGHTIKRNSARIASKSPTVSRTTHHRAKNSSQAYSGRSISRTSKHKRSFKNSQSTKRSRGHVSARLKPQ